MYVPLIIALVMTYIYRGHLFGPSKTVAASIDAEGEAALPAVKPSAESGRGPSLLRFAKPTAKDNPQVSKIVSEAMSYLGEPAGIIDARDKLNEALPLSMSERQRAFVKAQLSELADKWLFSRMIFPQDKLCVSYKVKPGDLLSRIGRQFKVPYEILMEINNISRPEALQAGTTIKVIKGPFHARVYRSAFTMDLYLQNTFVRSFPVGLGKPGMETPTGLWAVKEGGKMIQPRWTDPISGKTYEPEDPDYPLGSRWIGLDGLKGDATGRTGFAIHGTKKLGEISTASSQGCIRLRDDNVILVYNLLVPGDSRVEIME
jgi:LysM repeat protein